MAIKMENKYSTPINELNTKSVFNINNNNN